MAENIIIDGLSCDNCPEFKRCQEQQTKKEYAINQVLQDIPSEYANIIDRLKQIIPSITRCDYVLEKQLKRKEQECEKLKTQILLLQTMEIEELKNYKQSLAEIKKIMKKYCRKCKKHKFYHFKLCYTCKYTDILQKISECEVENE